MKEFIRNCVIKAIIISIGIGLCACTKSNSSIKTATATANGFGGVVSVTITTKNGIISDVVVEGEKETETVGGKAIEKLQKEMIETESIDVDTVSGATVTSTAVLSAAKKAWNELNGVEMAEVKMEPGVYTASAPGFRAAWDIEVNVTVDETSILSVEVNPDSADTVGIFDSAVELLPERIVENQSVAVDSICGATASSNGIKQAVRNALIDALKAGDSDESAISAFETVPAKENKTEEISTDILVVGLGASGTTAALSAAEAMYSKDADNVSVLAIDKAGRYGGASSLCAGVFAVNPKHLEEKYNNGNEFTDRDALLAEWLEYVDGDAKEEMIELLLDNSGDTLDWLVDNYGLELEAPSTGLTEADSNVVLFSYAPASKGMTVRRQHNIAFYDNCMEKFTEMGGKYMLETEAYELIFENGTVTGIKARNTADGTEYIIHAKKVIMGTGGFLSNSEMTTKYLSNEYYPLSGSWNMVGMTQNNGVLIENAIENGAATYNIGMCPAVHIIGTSGYLTTFEYHTIEDKLCMQTMKPTKWTEGDLPHYMGVSPDTLSVDMSGNRMTNEQNLNFNSWISGPNFYSIYGSDQVQEIVEKGLKHDPAYMMTVNLGANGWAPSGTPITNAFEVLDAAIEAGFVYKAESVEELADMIGADKDILTKTIEKYNESCENGVDEEFGKDSEYLESISGQYYYAIKMSNYPYSTCAGLDINSNFEVLNNNSEVVKGLYSVGLDSSGVLYSEKKPYVTYGGVDQGYAFTSGRIAGTNAANSLSE